MLLRLINSAGLMKVDSGLKMLIKSNLSSSGQWQETIILLVIAGDAEREEEADPIRGGQGHEEGQGSEDGHRQQQQQRRRLGTRYNKALLSTFCFSFYRIFFLSISYLFFLSLSYSLSFCIGFYNSFSFILCSANLLSLLWGAQQPSGLRHCF